MTTVPKAAREYDEGDIARATGVSVERQIHVRVNGTPYDVTVPNRRTLVDLLRYDVGLTGTKEACSVGVCGVCSVLLDGRLVASCLLLACQADGAEITTIEGLAGSNGELHPLQRSFIEHGGFQCGICTPGQIIAAKALLDEVASPSEEEIKAWMMGNLCRCTGYYQIVESIKAVVESGPTHPSSFQWGLRPLDKTPGVA
jgi:aerobic carbon-monoxide dehydrogenase small subunit